MTPFLQSHLDGWDINIEISQIFAAAPVPAAAMAGEDLLLEYYFQNDEMLCLAKGGMKGPIAICKCNCDATHLVCYLNPEYSNGYISLGNLLRLLPMRTILQHHGVQFFHAAQIAIGNKGILFTAPSGTGKTTQARLWKKHCGARVVCSDRTLVRNGMTYGYPVDGSEPVISGEVNSLGAIVLLSQSLENSIHRLKPSHAFVKLLPQLVIDGWNPEAKELAAEQILDLLQNCPVYHLACTPDERAVICLENCLKEDGVL